MSTQTDQGYRVNMRVDKRTGEHLAVIADAYRNSAHERFYMAVGESDSCWVELEPKYLTRCTKTVTEFPAWLKRNIDQRQGYTLNIAPRLYG